MKTKSKTELMNKIREGIEKSGFPLELEIGSILKKLNWGYSIGNLYKDFETVKMREMDISAGKLINGISVNLFIECKKSEDKQIVLYAPDRSKEKFLYDPVVKLFPIPDVLKSPWVDLFVLSGFRSLRLFKKYIPYANTMIVTKGIVVTQDNVNYLSSINGLVKKSTYDLAGNVAIKKKYRTLFLYIFIFDGVIFQLYTSSKEKFDLKEIQYGLLKYKPHFQIDSKYSDVNLFKTSTILGKEFIIEIISSGQFEKYIRELEINISK